MASRAGPTSGSSRASRAMVARRRRRAGGGGGGGGDAGGSRERAAAGDQGAAPLLRPDPRELGPAGRDEGTARGAQGDGRPGDGTSRGLPSAPQRHGERQETRRRLCGAGAHAVGGLGLSGRPVGAARQVRGGGGGGAEERHAHDAGDV